MSFSGYPASMRFLFNKLSGYSRNRVKQPVLSPQTAGYNDLVIFEIGAGQKVDLSTLSLHFTCTTTVSGGTAPVSCMPPRFTNSLIQAMTVSVNGVDVFSLENYNHLYHLLMSYAGGDYSEFRGSISEWTRGVGTLANGSVMTNVPLCCKNFLGFLNNGKILDTNLCGPVRVTLRLIPAAAMITTGGPTSTTLALSNMSIVYDTIQVNDNLYDSMIMQRLQSGGTIPICFQNWKSFMGSVAASDGNSNRIPANTQSLDMIIHTVLPDGYSTTGSDKGNQLVNGSSKYFSKGVAGITSAQLQVGSTYLPQYRPDNPSQLFVQTIDSIGVSQDLNGTFVEQFANAIPQAAVSNNALTDIYINGFFMFAVKLNHGSDSEYGQRILSGLDTTGSSVLVSATTFGGTSNCVPLTYLCQTSTLNIGAGRQLQLIE